MQVGPITLGFYLSFDADKPHTYAVGVIRWNFDEVAAVAIDGQHRLAALKQLHQIDPAREQDTRICVILVVPSERLGFRAALPEGGLLRLLRTVFIDLNKHAKPVKRARLILLDDTDPHSVIVRRLIGDKLRAIKIGQPTEEGRLPLGLVDWHSDEAKFDSGPYVTTVPMLDKIVELLVAAKPVADWSSSSAVVRQARAFEQFGYSPTEECRRRLDALKAAEEAWQEPFSYPPADLDRIRDAVGGFIAPIVSKTLTELQPYKQLLQLRERARALGPEFAVWYEAYAGIDGTPESQQHLAAVTQRVQAEKGGARIDEWEDLFKERDQISAVKSDELFFKVVFQGAYFKTLGMLAARDPFLGIVEGDGVTEAGTPAHLVAWANELIWVANGLLSKSPAFFNLKYAFSDREDQIYFWEGSALHVAKDTVDFTSSALERIAEWLHLVALSGSAVRLWRAAERRIPREFDEFQEQLAKEDEDYAGKMKRSVDWITVGSTANRGAMLRIADARSDSDDQSYLRRLAVQHFDRRVKHLWSQLRTLEPGASNGSGA